jgi:hypothetical protein
MLGCIMLPITYRQRAKPEGSVTPRPSFGLAQEHNPFAPLKVARSGGRADLASGAQNNRVAPSMLLPEDPGESPQHQPAAANSRICPRSWGRSGNDSRLGVLASDSSVVWNGSASASLIVPHSGLSERSLSTIEQVVRADTFRGKRIQFSAYLRTRNLRPVGAGLWLRAEDENRTLVAFQNMNDRRIVGNTDWSDYEIVIDVPTNADIVFYGAYMVGHGSLWIDDVRITSVDKKIELTAPAHPGGQTYITYDQSKVLPEPENLDFEDIESVCN